MRSLTVARSAVLMLLAVSVACGSGPAIDRAEPNTTSSNPSASISTGATTTAAPAPTTVPPTTVAAPPAVGASCPSVPLRAEPDSDRPRYDLALTADADTGVVTGDQRVTFTPDVGVDRLVFRLWANGPRPVSVGSSMVVDSVVEGSTPRRIEQPDATTVVVPLERTLAAGRSITLRLQWTLRVGGPVADRISRQAGSLRLGSFVPLLAWQPGVGWATEPATSGFAESTTSPTADWSYTVTVPDGFDVVASGTRGADGRFTATAARDIAVAVGRFATVSATAMAPDPVAVTVSVHDGVDDPERYLAEVVRSLETIADWYGPYPWPSYALSITPELRGGIEFPMHVMQGPGTQGRTTPHEVAHMWFYGLVGNNQALYPYLDEGLATYVEGRLVDTLGSMTSTDIPDDGRRHAGEPMTFWESRSSSYYRSVYVQTAAALARAGTTDQVDCALAHYVAGRAHAIATPPDLAAALDLAVPEWRPVLAAAGIGG